LITGFEALLELEEYIIDFDDMLNHFFVLAQVFTLFNTTNNIEVELLEKSFDVLKTEVANLVDFHEIKLFYSLLKLDRLFDNKRIKSIANRIFE
jgi:hypothetical protein